MIVINRQYLDRFKPYFDYYIYYVKPGTFLAFNKETLEYISFLYINYIPWKNSISLLSAANLTTAFLKLAVLPSDLPILLTLPS